jgi:hypothetical protein
MLENQTMAAGKTTPDRDRKVYSLRTAIGVMLWQKSTNRLVLQRAIRGHHVTFGVPAKPFLLLHRCVWSLHVPCEAQQFHQSNEIPGQIRLPPFQSVPSRRREGMMVIVETFTSTENTTQKVVSRMIACLVVASTNHVADRIDRESHVLHQKDSHTSSPQKSKPRSFSRPGDQPCNAGWD